MDDNTLKLAHQAGIVPGRPATAAQLADLVALVRADEREACAKVCVADLIESPTKFEVAAINKCAANIRARNHQPPTAVADRLARHGIPMPGDEK